MTTTLWAFDLLLILLLVGLAASVLITPDLFKAVVLFTVFGLLMAVAWSRLRAVDIALAEAAIGAGLTSALLLNALGHIGEERHPGDLGVDEVDPKGWPRLATAGRRALLGRGLFSLLILALGGVLAGIVLSPPVMWSDGLAGLVQSEIPRSGVINMVTAVLLNFRSYDTLLEVGVLLLAAIGAWSVSNSTEASHEIPAPGRILLSLVRVLVPLILLVAVYLLWAGTKAPGGAFQAGAVLGTAGVLLLLAGIVRSFTPRSRSVRVALVLGFGGFLGVALGVMVAGWRFLEYPEDWASLLIVLVEMVLMVSIGLILVTLFSLESLE